MVRASSLILRVFEVAPGTRISTRTTTSASRLFFIAFLFQESIARDAEHGVAAVTRHAEPAAVVQVRETGVGLRPGQRRQGLAVPEDAPEPLAAHHQAEVVLLADRGRNAC